MLTLAAPNAFKKGINLIAITEVNVPKTVLGDPVRIRQIVTNLITNAIKFTDQGYVLIRTKIEQESEKEYSFSFTISDTGIGISEEEQHNLFTAFNQADISITRRYGGSGLGLVICKKLCEKMHGRISLSSKVNKGSTFTVNLKLDKLLAYEIEKKQHRASSKIKALCFDDNPLYLESLCRNLEYLGIACQPIQYFQKLPQAVADTPDCNLIFISMNPGYEKQVEELLSKNNKITCVLTSKSPINECSLNAAHEVLYKPITMQKLHTLIEDLNDTEYDETVNHHELYALREQLSSLNPDILIAEDNPVNKMLLTSILSQHSALLVVDDGEMAVKACEEKKYHMLLLDLQMPKLNGLEAARMIRQHSLLNKQTPIVLITANSYDIVATDLIKSGVDFCLQKPIDEKSLLNQILGVINKTTDSSIDWPLCIQKVSGDRELAETFLAKFVEELQKNRDEFFQLWHQKNLNGLLYTAHKLHGACCFCGVPALEKQVTQLEKQAMNAGNVEELSNCFVELIQHIDAVLNEYHTHYSTKKPELSEQKEVLCQ